MSDTRLECSRSSDDCWALTKDLERMTEDIENQSVRLTWMTYDMVALRTSSELHTAMQRLQEAYERCRGAVCKDVQPRTDVQPDPSDSTLTQM